MNAPGPLGAAPQVAAVELSSHAAIAHVPGLRTSVSVRGSRLALGALGGLLACALLLAIGAANTDGLLPESVRPVPGWLAGPFGSTGLDLGVWPLIGVFTAMFACYIVAVRHAERLQPRVVLMAIAGLHAVLLLAPPLLSTDVFSYQAYSRIWSIYGGNVYLQGPHAIALDSVYPFIGAKWVNTPSAYGPLFSALSYPFAHLSIAVSALSYKAIATFASLGTVALVWHAARLRGLNPVKAAALVALNPLVIVYGVGGGHNDLLMLLLMTAGIWAMLAHRDRTAGVMTVLAGAVKLTGGLMLPFMLASEHGLGGPSRRRATAIGAGVAAAAVTVFGLAVFGTGQLHLFATLRQTQSAGDWKSIPGFIGTRLGLGTISQITGLVLGALFVALLLWLVVKVARDELDPIDGAGWATVAMLVTAGSLLPWYVCWLMPLAALGTDRRLWRASIITSGVVLAIQMIGYVPHANSSLGF